MGKRMLIKNLKIKYIKNRTIYFSYTIFKKSYVSLKLKVKAFGLILLEVSNEFLSSSVLKPPYMKINHKIF